MTSKSHYWLTDSDGFYVQVEGAARRDELAADGWNEAGEPGPNDKVWMQHDGTGAFAAFSPLVLEVFQARDWQLAVPPTARGDFGRYVALPDADQPQPAAQSLSVPETSAEASPQADPKPSKPAAGGDKKE